jgi:hypothetical protein
MLIKISEDKNKREVYNNFYYCNKKGYIFLLYKMKK